MPKTKAEKSKYIFLFLRILVVTAAIVWAISRIGQEQRWNSFIEHFRQMNIWIFVGTLCIFTLTHAIVGLRWWLLLRSQSVFINLWAAVRLYFLGWFYNNFMPSSVGGDLIRAWYVTRHTEKRFEAALSVFVDRVIGLLSTLMIAAFFYSVFLRGQNLAITSRDDQGVFLETISEYKWLFLIIIMIIAVVFCGLLVHRKTRAMLKKSWSSLCLRSMKIIARLKDAAVIYCSKPLTVLTVFGLTVFVQIMVISAFWVLGVNMGIEAGIKYYYVFFTLAWVFGAIPVSIGGVGVVEGFLVIMFTQFAGVEAEAALALALCQRIVWMITSLPGAAIHLIGAHLPKDFLVDHDQPIA